MKPGLQAGHRGELMWTVDPGHTITLGLATATQVTVFSTPSMIMLMERAYLEALQRL